MSGYREPSAATAALLSEARDVGASLALSAPGGAALSLSAYTMGVETGLVLGLLEPAIGRALLAAIDDEIHHSDPASVVAERRALRERYRREITL